MLVSSVGNIQFFQGINGNFSSNEIVERQNGLTFDDVLLMPCHSEINSRKVPNLKTQVTKNFNIDIPIISANMDTVTGLEMAKAMAKLGLGIIHCFMPLEEQIKAVKELKAFQQENSIKSPISVSVGVKQDGMDRT